MAEDIFRVEVYFLGWGEREDGPEKSFTVRGELNKVREFIEELASSYHRPRWSWEGQSYISKPLLGTAIKIQYRKLEEREIGDLEGKILELSKGKGLILEG